MMTAPQLSIRTRIIALVTVALSACLGAFLYFGQKLLIADKSAYILDAAYLRVSSASDLIRSSQSRFETLTLLAKNNGISTIATSDSQPFFARISFKNGPVPEVREVRGKIIARDLLQGLPWTAQELRSLKSTLVYIPRDGKYIDLASRLSESNIFYGRIVPTKGLLEGETREIELKILTDPEAKNLLSNEIWDTIASSEFFSGVKELVHRGEPTLLGYERLQSTPYWVISLSSKKVAFASTKELQRKTLLLGSGLLLVTLGLALLLLRSLARRIRALVDSTQHLSRGDFSHELKLGLNAHDELGVLSRAFNLMSRKIQELLIATADKARMEKELETAQVVQSRFFPAEPFRSQGITIDGHSLPASQCGGDFWTYSQVGKQVIVLMGDVTGHGLSAAFLTASIHSAFSHFTDQLKREGKTLDPEKAILTPLLELLNRSIYLSSSGNASFPCLCMTIDLESRVVHFVNSGHPVPFLFKPEGTFEIISSESHLPLGQDGDYPIRATKFKLHSSEQVLWYTDGLFDERKSDSTRLKKKELLENLAKKRSESANSGQDAHLSQLVLERARDFFSNSPDNRHDDITVISIEVDQQIAAQSVDSSAAA
ncbi:MAG: SpoIIE family protein phosphatase [Bdellovibrionales bacterium]|nr:SpoIIE family protein phosphatase [Bdellovibrionales bacterium]